MFRIQFSLSWNECYVSLCVFVIKIQSDTLVLLPPFNWTLGYTKFRGLVEKFDTFISDTKEVILAENPKLLPYVKTAEPKIKKMFDDRLLKIEDTGR